MSELHDLTGTEQVAALDGGEVSSRELTEHYLGRIDRFADGLGAFVTVRAQEALDDARLADQRRARGENAPLLGIPFGIKDLHPTAGVRTTMGSAALADFVPSDDAWTVRLLRDAGVVLLGKTNAAEFGATCFTETTVTDRPAVTPYDPTRYSSGSSGGSATAVASGLLPMAHASDGLGSTRTPAGTCHLIGVKPSRGLVSSAPASTFMSIGAEGPLTRTVEDAALLLDVMAHPWPGDLYGWQPPGTFAEAIGRRPDALRVAQWTDTGVPGATPHPESVRAVARTADLMRELGHEVREIDVPAAIGPEVKRAMEVWFEYGLALGVSVAVPADRRELLLPYTQHLLVAGEGLSGVEVATAQTVLARHASTYLAALADVDIALTPTTNGPAVPLGHYLADGPQGVIDRMLTWSCYTPFANLTGLPAVSVPSHLDADGLPHNVQITGRPRHDREVLALARQLEQAQLWDQVHPPCWDE